MKRVAVVCLAIALSLCAAYWLLPAGNVWAEPMGVEPPAATAGGEQIQEVKDAMERFKVGDYVGALKLLEKGVKSHAELPPAQLIMAQWFAQANQPAGIRNSLERAVLENPNDPEAFVILADLAMADGRVTEADLLYTKANAMLPAFKGNAKRKEQLQPRVLNGLARVAEARGDWAGTQKHLEAFLKLDPKDAGAMQRLARAFFLQKDDRKGAAKCYDMLREAKKVDPTVLTPEAQLAQLYEQYPDHENAKKWMAAALKQAPKDLRTRLVAAQWALESGDDKAAKEYSTEALRIDEKNLDARILRGVVALFAGDYKEAELYFEAAHNQSPSNFAASNNLSLALVEQDDEAKKNRALEYAENNARQYPRLAEAASTYGWVLYKKGRRDEAEKVLQLAASSGNVSPDTAFYLATVLADKNRPDDAKGLLKAALDTPRPFSKKKEAKALLSKLEKSGG